MLEKILNKLFPKKKEKIMNLYLKIKYKILNLKLLFQSNVDIYLLGTPEYGNLGDHAIANAERKLFKDLGKKCVEISSTSIMYNIDGIKKIIKNKDIVITGGGFLGNIWMNEENMVRKVIKNFPNNKITIFPQTIYYEDTEQGKKEKEITFNLYRKHKNLMIFAREKKTYDMIKKELGEENSKLVPDIVLYLNMTNNNIERKNKITICLRKDKEKLQYDVIDSLINDLADEIIYSDTVVNYRVTEKNRKQELNKKFREFQESKLIITNRLHGMIFAVITSTPCICADNITKKVSGVYEWIKDLEYIKLINENTTEEELAQWIEENKNKKNNYNEKILLNEYQSLIEEMRKK